MRVITGSARGTPLVAPDRGTRPVSDRAREGVFSSLGDAVVDAICLDLFAGSGALGIEALSRGAAACTFVDESRSATTAIHANLEKTRMGARATIVRREVEPFLRRGPGSAPRPDLVFVDPPYELAGEPLDRLFEALDASWLPERGWTVVVTRGHKGSLPAVPVHWAARRQLRYGDSLVISYRP
jgi:16S rRNA (guanine966-N2)-methyltransferase